MTKVFVALVLVLGALLAVRVGFVRCKCEWNSSLIALAFIQAQLAPASVNPEVEATKFADIGSIIVQSRIQKANLPDDLLVNYYRKQTTRTVGFSDVCIYGCRLLRLRWRWTRGRPTRAARRRWPPTMWSGSIDCAWSAIWRWPIWRYRSWRRRLAIGRRPPLLPRPLRQALQYRIDVQRLFWQTFCNVCALCT